MTTQADFITRANVSFIPFAYSTNTEVRTNRMSGTVLGFEEK